MSGCNSINTTCGICSGSWINVAKLLFPDLRQKKETLYIWAFLSFLLTHCLDSLGICQIISHYLAHLWEMPAIPLTTTHDVVIKLFVQVIKKRNGLHNHGVNLIWAELEFVAWQAKTNNILLTNYSDFVTSVSCVPDANKSPKMHKSSKHASRRTQRSIDQSIWRCFSRLISCFCDFCGCSWGCCLTMHISFSLCCALPKNYLLSVWSHKGPSIFNLGLVFWTGTQWFWSGTHGLFTSLDKSQDSP